MKKLRIALIIEESSAEIFSQQLWAKPTENLLIKSCHGPMVRSPQKSTSVLLWALLFGQEMGSKSILSMDWNIPENIL